MRRQYRDATNPNTQNTIIQILDGLNGEFIRDLFARNPDLRPRWWEYTFGAPTPTPVNVKYQCEARLGSPSMASCELALFQMRVHGPVVLDPAKGPIIQQSGM